MKTTSPRHICRTLSAFVPGLLPCLLALPLAGLLTVSSPASSQPYNPPEGSPAYWETPGFREHPISGPQDARGIVFWSHGVNGKNVQWKGKPAPYIKAFASNGWDIVKINRNNLHECGWTCSGVKHVADLKQRAQKARAEGYKHIVAAGQSYGGAISLEAAEVPGLIDVVIAAAPGHGSDACGSGSGAGRISDTLTGQLVTSIAKVKSPRIVLTMADGDECMGFNNPTAALRQALVKSGTQFVFLDDQMPIRGHGAANSHQFAAWYQLCLVSFANPQNTPDGKETRCAPPDPVPRYLLTAGFTLPTMQPANIESMIGSWSGEYSVGRQRTRNICVAVTDQENSAIRARSFWGAGPKNDLSMNRSPMRRFEETGDGVFLYKRGKYRMRLARGDSSDSLELLIVAASGREFQATLKRGCRLHN